MGDSAAKLGLDGVIAAAKTAAVGGAADRPRALPPVHLWHPEHCGEIDIVIRKDGRWVHEGGVIGREALVRLFSTILRKDPDGFVLVTPAEKLTITVEDAPFVAVGVDRAGEAVRFTTNVGDEVEVGPEHPLRIETDPQTGEPRPYVLVRGGLEALITRAAFYDLVELAEERDGRLGVASNGAWFDIAPQDAPA